MFQTTNVATSVEQLFRAHPTLPGLVPGGLLYGLLKVPDEKPYARLLVEVEGEPEISGTGGRQSIVEVSYLVQITVWAGDALPVSETIQAALHTLISPITKLAFLTDNAWSLENWQVDAPFNEEAMRSNQANVFAAGATWRCVLQENR